MAYTPAIDEIFPTEAQRIDEAAERAAERVQRERATLVRPDGSRVFGDAEHAERDAAILADAGATYDAETARHLTTAEEARARPSWPVSTAPTGGSG